MPDWKEVVRTRLKTLRLQGTKESALSEELSQHLEDHYRDLRSGGTSPQEAYRQTVAELDDLHPIQVQTERSRMPKDNLSADFWRDLRYSVRTIRQAPLFALFVILTLALGIGANTTVFTVINTLILNALPAENPSALAAIGIAKGSGYQPTSYADLKDYRERASAFESLAGYTSVRVITWQANTGAERMFTELVTGNYFSTLGLKPAAGRFFTLEEDGTPGAHPVAVMNYGVWQRRFGADPTVVGSTLRLNNQVVTIIGIAPANFIGVNAIFGPDVWIPAAMSQPLFTNEKIMALTDRAATAYMGVGRLKAGVSRSQAQANLATIAADLAREYPATNEGRKATVVSIRDAMFAGMGGSSAILFGSAILLMVVAIVLLIACSNVANLLLARAAARQQEMAVRLAMGASRFRLIRQLLTESVFLGLLSGVVGLFIAYAGLKLLFGTLPGAANFVAPRLDVTVFLFALAISLATGFLFGTVPALRASRAEIAITLKNEARTAGRSRGKIGLANVLLVGQVAFSFLLLVTATLFLRSIEHAYEMSPGFQTANLALFMSNPGQAGFAKPQTVAFYRDVRERLSRNPDIASASWASNLPLWARPIIGLEVEGRDKHSKAEQLSTILTIADTHYFETAGVTLERGRTFDATDQENSAPVAIVNTKLAHDFFPDGNAIGRRIQLPGEKQMRQVVGIARMANYSTWGEAPQLCVYVPLEQKFSDSMTLYVRSKADPHAVVLPVQRELRAAAPTLLISDTRIGSDIVNGGLFQARVGVALLTVFGLLALGLASIGLYGIMAYSVNQRKREIGLRMALGAAQASVMRLVLNQGMRLVSVGVGIGLVAALIVGQFLSRMLYGVNASDPLSIVGAAVVLLTSAFLACYLPARRASRVDPLVALREG